MARVIYLKIILPETNWKELANDMDMQAHPRLCLISRLYFLKKGKTKETWLLVPSGLNISWWNS